MAFSAEGAQRSEGLRRSSSGPLWTFLKGFVKHPAMVASVIPSSRRLIDKMLEPVDWANCKLFVEYGPGVGTFSSAILERLAPDATLIAIDTNADFIDYLNSTVRDSRLVAVTGSAAHVRSIMSDCGFSEADFILSGLPFSTLPDGVGAKIARETYDALRSGGAFLVYQFSGRVEQAIAPFFERIEEGGEWRNIPPAKLFWAWKE